MPLFNFALQDWARLQIGGRYECYVRPDRPYTIIIDNDRNLVALTLELASDSNWYAEEFSKLLEADEVLALNQQNLFFLEREALLAEKNLNLHHDHFYKSASELEEKIFLYTAIFEVSLLDGSIGYLGLRSPQEYLLVYNAIPYLGYEPSSLEYQKAVNILASFTGVVACNILDVTDNITTSI